MIHKNIFNQYYYNFNTKWMLFIKPQNNRKIYSRLVRNVVLNMK